MNTIKLKQLHLDARLPEYKTEQANGADLFACNDDEIYLHAQGQSQLIPLGFSMELPGGYAALLLPRSGLGHKQGIVLGNLVGLIDSDYRGEVFVSLWNRGLDLVKIKNGDRIAQMLIVHAPQYQFEWAQELDETERGEGGFGSTGEK